MRRWFADEGFVEVDTPALQVSPGIERHIQPLRVDLHGVLGAGPVPRYLHTSPEFAMKMLLAAGETRIVQIAHVYRDGEASRLHHPEFTLAEWYRAGADYTAMMADVEALIAAVAKDATLKWGERTWSPAQGWRRMTVADAFRRHAGIDLLATVSDPDDPAPDPGHLRKAAESSDVSVSPTDTWEDIFHRVMLDKVEPALAGEGAVFLYDYPACLAALSRRKANDPRVAERVEAYILGVELANGYSELSDAAEQRSRFASDRALFERLYGEAPPLDEDFLAALEHMGAAAGIALGVDRLIMLLTGADRIGDVLWAPVAVPEPD